MIRADDAKPMDTPEPSSSEPPSPLAPSDPDDAPGRERTHERPAGAGLRCELLDPDRLLGEGLLARTGAAIRGVLGLLNETGEVRARVVNDETMSAAHVEYLDVEGTTDVLTFDMTEITEDGSRELDVDLLICIDEAARQSKRLGHAVEHELALYVVHGILHCTGFDDLTEDDARAMHAEEDRLLAEAGIGRVYSSENPGGDS